MEIVENSILNNQQSSSTKYNQFVNFTQETHPNKSFLNINNNNNNNNQNPQLHHQISLSENIGHKNSSCENLDNFGSRNIKVSFSRNSSSNINLSRNPSMMSKDLANLSSKFENGRKKINIFNNSVFHKIKNLTVIQV